MALAMIHFNIYNWKRYLGYFPGGVIAAAPVLTARPPKNNPDYAEVCQEARDELSPQTPRSL